MMVSIIVPVFNCEKYIHRCLESLIYQTYQKIEIVLVDDGSNDSSLDIITQYADRDSRVVVVSQSNQGVSAARNTGLENATGQYVMFVDADDYVELDMVAEMVSKIQSEKTLVFCDNTEIWADHVDERRLFPEKDKSDLNKNLVLMEIASGRAGLVCGKLFERSLAEKNNIRFDQNVKLCEDQLFFLEVVSLCKHFIHTSKALYHYDRRNENSATIKYQDNAWDNQLYVLQRIEYFLLKNDLSGTVRESILQQRYCDAVQFCINNEVLHATLWTVKDKAQKIKDIVNNEKVRQIVVSLEAKHLRSRILKWGFKMRSAFYLFCMFYVLEQVVLPVRKKLLE